MFEMARFFFLLQSFKAVGYTHVAAAVDSDMK